MSASERYEAIRAGIRQLRIVILALLVGVLGFTAFVGYRAATGAGGLMDEPSEVPLTPLLVGIAVVQAILFGVVRSGMLARARKRIAEGTWNPQNPWARATGPLSNASFAQAGDQGRVFQAWMGATLVGCAGLEGAALLCLVGALLEGSSLGLVAGGGVALLLAFQIPTNTGVDRWLQDQMIRLPAALHDERD